MEWEEREREGGDGKGEGLCSSKNSLKYALEERVREFWRYSGMMSEICSIAEQ